MIRPFVHTVRTAASQWQDLDALTYAFDCDNDGDYEIGPQAGATASCAFDDDGSFRVNVRVVDSAGGYATGCGSSEGWLTCTAERATLPAGIGSTMVTRTGFVERFGKIEDLDRSFDLKFWQAQSSAARMAATWEMIVFAYAVKGEDVRQLRLQRSVESLQRQPG